LKYSEQFDEPMNIVVIFADSGRQYLSKAFNDQWMVENGLIDESKIANVFNRVISAEDALKLYSK
jgi:cystathionine beta-synthase